VCEHGPGGVGRCPNCRGYLRVDDGGVLCVAAHTDTCTLCRQPRVIVETRGHVLLCDACLLGTQHALLYECQGCGRMQRIPHPMWRYQPTAVEFSTETWACHSRCGAQTHWRVAAADAANVPVADAPESWGLRETWIAAVREQRRRERNAGRGHIAPPAARRREGGILVAFAALLLCSLPEVSGWLWEVRLPLLLLGAGALYLLRRGPAGEAPP